MAYRIFILTLIVTLGGHSALVRAIDLGLLDNFEETLDVCVTDNWTEGSTSPNPPTGEPDCGELSSCCLWSDSTGGFGPGNGQIVFNEAQWAGDYLAAGVNAVQFQAANASLADDLMLRIGVTNGTSCYVSTTAALLPPGAPGPDGLELLSFFLTQSSMVEVPGNLCGGGEPLSDVLSSVTQLRILSAETPAWSGDALSSTLHIDNVQSKSDVDMDGINDDVDNCVNVFNPGQRDTDGDGFGSRCDGDFNNDCATDSADLMDWRDHFLVTGDTIYDLNGNLLAGPGDLFLLRNVLLGKPPGPSGLANCDTSCAPPPPLGSNEDFAGLEMFFRGGLILDWGASSGINNFSDQGAGLYLARFEVGAGAFEWKIADEGWAIEYCTTNILVEGATETVPIFGCSFPANGTIEIQATGCYEFSMQTDGNIPPAAVEVTFDLVP